jgi:toxin HigB-1
MIRSFRRQDAEKLFHRESVRRFKAIERVALRKLQQIDFAKELSDLAAPGGNRLEALKGDRKGQHSIRINDRWRICFVWRATDAYEVEIVDYH